jgi:nicotinamidase-related amidase
VPLSDAHRRRLIGYQNDFASDGGALHDAVEEVMEPNGILENTRRMVEAVRAFVAVVGSVLYTVALGLASVVGDDHP